MAATEEQPPSTARGRGTKVLKQERAVRTYGQLLQAAADLFAKTGFVNVTLADIAEHAGVTKGALYFHFMNKEAIAVAVMDEYYVRLAAVADDVGRASLSPLDAAAELIMRTTAVLRRDTVFQSAVRLQKELFLFDNQLPTPFVSFIDAVGELLAEGRRRGQLPEESDPMALARVLVAAFYGAQHISWVLTGRADVVERVREVIDAIVPGRSSGPPGMPT
ncbi:ScbR family autoregulator-binding transcription factor [Streptomyces sp. OM5714]|uniref:ScbR family autoregulator-binding transcription factor n=1 Tax=Streptomyces sp. OM5714 TaxID=2602736 RepID=UPI0013D9B0E6|nr:ScbR family autoregulator-binding transcription factor [Streptomyces sp. OM5714]KAF2776475.1 TetR-family transcriptional regulator [Streptomyces sp. OM5714]